MRDPKPLSFCRAALLAALAACGTSTQQPPSAPTAELRAGVSQLVIGMPNYRDDVDEASLKPFAAYLTAALGVPVKIRRAEPYQALPALLRSGAIDVAEIPPLAYVHLREQAPGIQLVATVVISGNPTYLGHFYVRSDSRYHSLSDLRGARIGYVNRDSSSGYLFPRDMLRQKGYDPDTFFSSEKFFGKHSQVLDAVTSGEVDVGAAEDVTSEWLGPTFRPEGLRVIAKTERIPNDCIAARAGLDLDTQQALLHALQNLHAPVRDAAEIMSAIGVNGWIAADESRYDRVRLVLAHENAAHQKPAPQPH